MIKRGNKRESRFLIKDKKGLQLAINTVVIVAISILVLIGLIVFWNYQTSVFSDFLKNLAGKTNVDALVTSCNSLVGGQGIYDYCCVEREVKYKDEASGGIREEKNTCEELAEKFPERINKLNCENAGC